MKKLFKLVIRGKVHGVGFRFSCMEAAYRFGVKGFVRNKSDGSVYVEAEGMEENLNLFRQWCRKGPLWAQVNEIEEEEINGIKDYKSFDIIKH
ncbi:MAG: acylphosphatase [Bacteroidales bacterium]|nr:acylphosphatase [Bacteroidales bacterium]